MSNILNEFLSKFRNFDTEDLYNYCIHKGFNTWFVVEKIACNTRFLQHFCLSIIVSYLYVISQTSYDASYVCLY